MNRTYKIAGQIIEISSHYDSLHEYCRDYIFSGEPDFIINAAESDIDLELTREYSPDELENLILYRKLSEIMPDYGTFLMHGSAIAINGAGCIFTAPSGTGKSTHTKFLCELLKDKAVMVNDDKPLITALIDKKITVHGSPFNGKHRRGNNISVPLKAVCILERSEHNNIHEIAFYEAYTTLLAQIYRPATNERLAKTLELLDRMNGAVKFYRLGCNMSINAAEVSYNAIMKGE
ncbi:MAG: hypothetical protein IJS99_08900 [Synergistaceae bacterium]|nr:hypothetical protein [Synergistaceae bacterium]